MEKISEYMQQFYLGRLVFWLWDISPLLEAAPILHSQIKLTQYIHEFDYSVFMLQKAGSKLKSKGEIDSFVDLYVSLTTLTTYYYCSSGSKIYYTLEAKQRGGIGEIMHALFQVLAPGGITLLQNQDIPIQYNVCTYYLVRLGSKDGSVQWF